MKRALFPGSFDPFTRGHYDIIKRGLKLFDELIIGIGVNSQKKTMFTLEQRKNMIYACFPNEDRLKVEGFDGLTVEFAKHHGINFLFRGLRNAGDLEYERPIALINRHLDRNLETVFLLTDSETAHISSTLVREVIRYGARPEGLVPDPVMPLIEQALREQSPQ